MWERGRGDLQVDEFTLFVFHCEVCRAFSGSERDCRRWMCCGEWHSGRLLSLEEGAGCVRIEWEAFVEREAVALGLSPIDIRRGKDYHHYNMEWLE